MIGCWGGGHPDDGERETVKRPVRRDAKVGNMMAGKSTECSHFFPNFFFSFFFIYLFFFPLQVLRSWILGRPSGLSTTKRHSVDFIPPVFTASGHFKTGKADQHSSLLLAIISCIDIEQPFGYTGIRARRT